MALFEAKGLTKVYDKTVALDAVDLSLEAGRIVGLLGPNGSGKTTLIKVANGLLRPKAGSLLIDGKPVGVETKKIVAYLPDREYLPDYLTIEQLLAFYGEFYEDFSREKAEGMLASLTLDRTVVLKKLSKGNREKLQLILVMARNAKLYFLDEPIAGVDPAARDYILRTIITNYNEDATVVISTHLISDIEKVLDDVVFLKQGKVVLHEEADALRSERGMGIDALFREEFKC